MTDAPKIQSTRPRRGHPAGAGTIRILLRGAAALALVAACAGDATRPAVSGQLQLRLHGLRSLDRVTEGSYEAWIIGRDGGVVSAGRFEPAAEGVVNLSSPATDAKSFLLTVEPPGDSDGAPSSLRLAGGPFVGGTADLSVTGFVTSGVTLESRPGTHVLFTPSDNAELGYPSHEDAGVWLFNIRGDTIDGSFFLTFTPLARAWIYEGWVVRDLGTPHEVWLSYGKFEPDITKKLRARDDTGLGAFSGQLDFREAMQDEIIFPGDDWLANPHGYPLPSGLTLPVDLNGCYRPPFECAAEGHEYGPSRWTHVITIEPRSDLGENPWAARPFLLRPYRNPVGDGPPDEARTIVYHPEDLPGGTVTVSAGG